MPQSPLSTSRDAASRVSYCACLLTVVALFVISLLDREIQERKTEAPTEEIYASQEADLIPTVNSYLTNFTGYYKGTWKNIHINDEIPKMHFVTADEGNVLIEFKLDRSTDLSLEIISGDVVLKNGLQITDEDVRLKIEGAYVVDIGRAHAILKPSRPIIIPLTDEEINSGSRDYRKALRKEAVKWSQSVTPPLKFGLSANQQLEFNKECEFHLDIHLKNESLKSEIPESNNIYENKFPMDNVKKTEDDTSSLKIEGLIYSPNCNTSISVEIYPFHLEHYYSKAVHYTLAMAITTFVQIMLLLKQMERSSTPGTAVRVSMLSISQQAVIDAYLCLMHLTTGIVIEPLFNAFAMVAFFEFILFAVFEMRYMLIIWRAQRNQSNDPWNARRELSILYTRFYGSLMLGMLVAFKFQRYIHWVLVIFYSFWIPQIVHCIKQDVRQILKPSFIFGTTVTRLFLPLYLYGCPKNLLGVQPSTKFCVLLIAYVFFQALLLTLQHYYGPHCFVPKRFLPDKHDYFRPLTQNETAELLGGDEETGHPGVKECVICMNPCDVRRPISRMITPCDHIFHPHCLQRWMDVKMECPTCRQPLPPM